MLIWSIFIPKSVTNAGTKIVEWNSTISENGIFTRIVLISLNSRYYYWRSVTNESLVIISKNTQETHRSKLFKTKKSLQQHSCLSENSQVPPNLQQDDEIIEKEIRNLKERDTRLVIKKRIHKALQQWKKTRIVRLDSWVFFCDDTLFCYRNRFDRINFIMKKPS